MQELFPSTGSNPPALCPDLPPAPRTILGKAFELLCFVWSHPANQGKRFRAILRLVVWQLWKRLVGVPKTIRLPTGVFLRCYRDSVQASLAIYCRGMPDFEEMSFLCCYLREGDRFVDVGANIGIYTLLAASIVGREGLVEAFEPDPLAFGRLRENVERNGFWWVKVHQAAVLDRNVQVAFKAGQDALSALAAPGDGSQTVNVVGITLDATLRGAFALGKMDIEGAEPLAFRGAERLLSERNPPVWILEINGLLRRFGVTEEAFSRWLLVRGYRLAKFDVSTGKLLWEDRPWKSSGNCLAVAVDRLGEIQTRIESRLGAAGARGYFSTVKRMAIKEKWATAKTRFFSYPDDTGRF